jgi:amino-acid N-acetyltransferase
VRVVYRRAAAADLAGIEALLVESGLPVAGVREWLDGYVVAESGGRLVGVAGLEVHGGDGVLRSVAVDESARGWGVGRALTERVLESAGSADLRRVFLLTTTAEGYFPRWGFRPVGREEVSPEVRGSVEFREACPATATAMVLTLPAVVEPGIGGP